MKPFCLNKKTYFFQNEIACNSLLWQIFLGLGHLKKNITCFRCQITAKGKNQLLGQIFLKSWTYLECFGLQQAIGFDSPKKKITNSPKIHRKKYQPMLTSYKKHMHIYKLVYVLLLTTACTRCFRERYKKPWSRQMWDNVPPTMGVFLIP